LGRKVRCECVNFSVAVTAAPLILSVGSFNLIGIDRMISIVIMTT
jgi:hypothetical protein